MDTNHQPRWYVDADTHAHPDKDTHANAHSHPNANSNTNDHPFSYSNLIAIIDTIHYRDSLPDGYKLTYTDQNGNEYTYRHPDPHCHPHLVNALPRPD